MEDNGLMNEGQELVLPQQDMVTVNKQMDPMEYAQHLQKLADAAPLMKQATETIMFTKTYAADWKGFGDKMALNSAGAERIRSMFPIKITNVRCLGRQDFDDNLGKGYRYVYECDAEMYEQRISATGTYSTRDKFLGYANSEYRPIEDINENDIQQAAHRRCCGNAIKAILGIRNVPKAEWERIMRTTSQDPTQAGAPVQYNEGSQGGKGKAQHRADGKEAETRTELKTLILRVIRAGCSLAPSDDGKSVTVITDDMINVIPEAEAGSALLKILTTFEGKDNDGNPKPVFCEDTSKLKGKWLNGTKAKLAKAVERHGSIPDLG